MIVINFLVIISLVSVESENRKLDIDEKRRYEMRTRITALIFLYIVLF
ncbi:accessory gene regulator B family protein [Dorea longicatena]